MENKSLGMAVLFGSLGVIALILAWLWPMPVTERILSTLMGFVGLIVALAQAPFKHSLHNTDAEPVSVEVEVKNEP